MLKQIANNEWTVVPTPCPEELKTESQTVIRLAQLGFVYHGFDGNFHSFVHRFTKNSKTPTPNEHYFEELLVCGTNKSILIGYCNSYYNPVLVYHRFSYKELKCGAGYILFEAQLKDIFNINTTIDKTSQEEYDLLKQPTSVCSAYLYAHGKEFIKKKFDTIRTFIEVADLEDFKM